MSERSAARPPALAEVREAVKRDWEHARRIEARERLYQQLLARYSVTIEGAELAQNGGAQPKAP